MADVEMAGESVQQKGTSEKTTDDDMTVPFCVDPITFVMHISRWKDLVGGLLLSITTTVCLGLVLICQQEVQISESYGTCPVISIVTSGVIVFSNYMLWRSGQIGAVYRKLARDQAKLHECRCELDNICRLADDTTKLTDTTVYLNATAKNMAKLQKQMKENTNEMFHKVVNLKDHRKDIGDSLEKVAIFLEDLGKRDEKFKEKLQDLFDQVDALGKYLQKLQRARNKLSQENDNLRNLKNDLEDQLQEFNVVKEEIILNDQWANNVFEMGSYLEQRYIQLVELTTNYEQNYIMQVVHQCEFIDGKPGWNRRKVEEFCERLPQNCPEKIKNEFYEWFDQLEETMPNGVVNYKAMQKLVKEKIIPYSNPIITSQNGVYESSTESKSSTQ